jgi:transposase
MIPAGLEVFVAREPVNMRLSFDRLMGLASSVIGRSPRSRALFVFFGMRRETLKILFCDDSGVCIFHKRLDRGRFRIPDIGGDADSVTISEAELEALIKGLSLDAGPARRRGRPTAH